MKANDLRLGMTRSEEEEGVENLLGTGSEGDGGSRCGRGGPEMDR